MPENNQQPENRQQQPANTAEAKNQYSLYDAGPDPTEVARRLGLFSPLSDRDALPDARK